MLGYRISTDRTELDIDAIHSFISRSYWAENIPKDVMRAAIEHSLCFGVFADSGEQVGFARLITDYATFAYLADVYIADEHQGKGLCKWLLSEILQGPDVQGMRRINLATRDAHSLYEKFGFTNLKAPENMMEITRPDIYKNA